MNPERWQQVNDLFQSAAKCPPEERTTFLDEACHGDKGLRREVESLIASYERAENFIETPAFELAPELLTNVGSGALVGELIGHYRIVSLIGGGMGEVYLARDERLGRKVALKLLPEHFTTDETRLSRFKIEARAASALNHPNILTVYEIGTEGNRHFIATEFIEGITLRAALTRGRMTLRDALEISVQVASALAAAHEAGVVHRDIKPENIMLRPDGYAKVLDFGIAKLTQQQKASDDDDVGTTATLQTRPGLVLGTSRYMSPEQARGQTVDARTDIWSLGVVLYEMVAGTPPFRGETPGDCIACILKTEPPSLSRLLPNLPVNLQSVVQRALRKNIDERYQTIKEMLADLRDLKGEREREGTSSQAKARAEAIPSKIKHHKHRKKQTPGASIRKLRDELIRFERGAKRWAIGVTALLLISFGVAIWYLRGPPELRGAVPKYAQAEAEVGAPQGDNNQAAERETYDKLGKQLHLDPKMLRKQVPEEARKLKDAADATLFERASANYVERDYREAERLAIEAAREAQQTQPTNTKGIVERLELAGRSAQRATQYSRALGHFQEAEKLTDQKGDLKEWATVQHDIADLLVVWGKYGDAEKRLRNVIEVLAAALGPEHPDTLDSRHRLIYPLTRQTRYREAETEARQVLELRRKVLGSENFDTIVSRYNLAETLADQGKDVEAEVLYREVIQLDEKLLGSDHPRTLAARLGLATVLTNEGKNVEAESLYREVIKLDEKIYGLEHPNTLNDRQNLATTLHDAGKYRAAEAEYRDVIRLETKVIGPEHPDLLALRNNLAQALDDQGKFGEAEAECHQIIPLERKVLGPENRVTLNSRGNLAVALIGQGKFPEAEIECDAVLNVMERVLGLDHPDTRDFTVKLATALSHQSRTEKAIEIAKRAEEHARQSLDPENAFTQAYAKLVQDLQVPKLK